MSYCELWVGGWVGGWGRGGADAHPSDGGHHTVEDPGGGVLGGWVGGWLVFLLLLLIALVDSFMWIGVGEWVGGWVGGRVDMSLIYYRCTSARRGPPLSDPVAGFSYFPFSTKFMGGWVGGWVDETYLRKEGTATQRPCIGVLILPILCGGWVGG